MKPSSEVSPCSLAYAVVIVSVIVLTGCSLSSTRIESIATSAAALPTRPASTFIDSRSQQADTTDQEANSEAFSGSVQSGQPAQYASAPQPQTVYVQPQPVYVIAPNCAPRYSWSIYYVKYGDTLARISARYGTTIASLAYANCIADPNRIYVGQVLRVPYYAPPYPPPHHPPHYPPPPTWTPQPMPPTPIPPIIIGSALTIAPYAVVNNNVFTLNPDELITISWSSAFPTATLQVAFEIIAPTGGSQVIGIDTNLGDGASIVWRAVPGVQGTLRAIAAFNGGYPPQASDSYYVIVPAP